MENMLLESSLINEELGEKMNEIMRLCFKANAVCDVIAVRFDTQFAMPKASDIFHHTIAHAFPIAFADTIGEYLNKRNYPLYYGNIEKINFIHSKVHEYLKEYINVMYEINEAVNEATRVAETVPDYSAIDFLGSFQSSIVDLYIKQAFVLYNASISDERNTTAFNDHFGDLIIVPNGA